VLPEFQRQGIGSALVRSGLKACREQGHSIVVVLGHPEYYSRLGFSAKLAEPLLSPFGGREAWMAMELVPGALKECRAGPLSTSVWHRGGGRPIYRSIRRSVAYAIGLWPEVDMDELREEGSVLFASRSTRKESVAAAEEVFVLKNQMRSVRVS